jgi:hypothetical protein
LAVESLRLADYVSEVVDALRALAEEGIVVEASVWATEDDSYSPALLGGRG